MSVRGAYARRAGFGASVATGLALMALSVGGMATVDDELQAAAEPPANERVVIDTRETTFKSGGAGDRGDCPREQQRRGEDAGSSDPA